MEVLFMTKYTLIVTYDWKKRGKLPHNGFSVKFEVKEKDMQSFIQKCIDNNWIIISWE
jgi:hypothetical protein